LERSSFRFSRLARTIGWGFLLLLFFGLEGSSDLFPGRRPLFAQGRLREWWLNRRKAPTPPSPAVSNRGTLSEHRLSVGSAERRFLLYLPPAAADATALRPVVILLHGGGGNPRQALQNYPLQATADREGFMVVAPFGSGRWIKDSLLTWNVQFGFGYARQAKIDEIAFMRTLIDHLIAEHHADPERVFVTGLSNGGILSHWVAAHLADRITAIAPVVATIGGRAKDQTTLQMPPPPTRPVSVILFNCARDLSVPLAGGWQQRSIAEPVWMVSASDTADWWVKANGCHPTPQIDDVPERKFRRFTWTGGREGSEVILYVLFDQGHAWPGGTMPRAGSDPSSPHVPAHDVMWDFFKTRPRGGRGQR
jgi:polyhydroxybutyrate depolymerase